MPACPSCGMPLPEGSSQCPRCTAATGDLRTPFPPIQGYEAVRPLGEGGMGAVYLATDQMLHRRVAVKVVSRRIVDEPEAMTRFLREARSMAQIEHPHIVRVYSFGQAEGQPYLVMEYVEGQDLATRIAREGPLPIPEALRITRQAAEALEAAWDQQVVHRDIKPSNILLDKRNQVRVGDFGLAKPLRADVGTPLTQSSYVLGTPHYASPEQVRGQSLDFRSDIYSLGLVLYEMLTGRRPFEGTTPFDIMTRQVSDPLPFVQEKRRDVPDAVARLVEWMTQKDPARRPASYRQLLEALDTALDQGTVRLTPEAFTPVEADITVPLTPAEVAKAITPEPLPQPPSPRQRLLLAAPVAAVLLALAGWLIWKQFEQPAAPPKAEKRLVVAVTPFYGPDDDSAKEGRVMAALVERAVVQRLAKYDVKVLGVEETREPVRDHEAARALGEKLGATVVVWGEAFALRGETEIQPYFTLVPLKAEEKQESTIARRALLGADPLAALQQRSAEAMKVGAAAPNQIEVRKTSAAGVGDMVLLLAGVHALYTEQDPAKAIEFFREVPETAESLRYLAEAHLRQEKKDFALALIQGAVKLDPRSAPAQAFLGDLLMEEGKVAEAEQAYRKADETGGAYSTRHAISYQGKLYLAEKVTEASEKYTEQYLSGYLLALDPATGHVVERYRLPDPPTGFTADENGFRITYQFDEGKQASIGFSFAQFDRPIYYTDNFLNRRNSWRAGERLARNFLNALGPVKPEPVEFPQQGAGTIKDLPNTLPELEAAMRKAIDRDLTQPWHVFFLGQALWAQGRRPEAEGTWATLFDGYEGTPYFEYAVMANYFERFGQTEWADQAFEEALKRRKAIPQPVDSTFLIGRLFTVPTVVLAARRSQRGQDLERDHLWLQRARDLTGASLDAEDLAAAAWERYFREQGRNHEADREAAVRRKVASHPGSFLAGAARFDFALYTVGSLALGLLLVAALVLARAAARCQRHPLEGWWLDLTRGTLAVIVFAVGAFLAAIAGIVLWEGGETVAALVVGAFGLLVMLSVVFHRRLSLTVSTLLVGTLAGGLFLIGLALAVSEKNITPALMVWAMALALALSYRFRRRLGLSWQGLPSRRDFIAAISVRERVVLIAAMVALQLVVGLASYEVRTLIAGASMPFGIMDAMGCDRVVAQMEGSLKELDTPERRYVTAVSNHLAGHRERARELYESLPGDARAQQNLAALTRGELAPPVALTSEELVRGLASRPWKVKLRDFVSPGTLGELLVITGEGSTAGPGLTFWAWLAVFVCFVVSFILVRPRPGLVQSPPGVHPKRQWLYRLGCTVLPGAYDLRFGSIVRGYVIVVLACFLFLLGLLHLKLEGPLAGAPGIISGIAVPNIAGSFPLPTPPGAAADAEAVWAYHFWTLFWAYPYAKLFWPFAGLSVLVVLVYHATRLRRIWQL